MQRQRLFVMAMLLILGMTFNSCMQDDRELLSEQQLSASSRSEVRDFQEHFLGVYDEDKLRAAFSGNEFTPLEFKGLRPFWDKAHVNKLGSELEVIEVPLSADELDIVFPQLLSVEELKKYQGKTYHLSLIRERNLKTQKVKEFFLCYVPNIETLEKGLPDYYHLLSLPKDFSGELILFDLQLKPFYRYNIERGHTKERYLHVEKGGEEFRAWVWTEECYVMMHQNGWSVEAIITPQKVVIATNPYYDPSNHYFTLECDGYYDWVDDRLAYIVGADGTSTRTPKSTPGLPNYYAPGDVSYLHNPAESYGGGGSATVNHLYPAELSKNLLGIVNPEGITGFTADQLELLSRAYEGMLQSHPIHAKVDKILKSYPNLKKLNGVKLHKEQTKPGSASISRDLVLNIYGAENIKSEHLFHELIHLAQYQEHKLTNIADKAYRGIMEFEGWLLRDIIKFVEGRGKERGYSREPFGLKKKIKKKQQRRYGEMDIDKHYKAWLRKLTNKGKNYPTEPIDRTKFRQFAKQFLEESFSYPIWEYPLDENLVYEPSLLDSIFKEN